MQTGGRENAFPVALCGAGCAGISGAERKFAWEQIMRESAGFCPRRTLQADAQCPKVPIFPHGRKQIETIKKAWTAQTVQTSYSFSALCRHLRALVATIRTPNAYLNGDKRFFACFFAQGQEASTITIGAGADKLPVQPVTFLKIGADILSRRHDIFRRIRRTERTAKRRGECNLPASPRSISQT